MALRFAPTFLRTIRQTGVRAMSQTGQFGEGSGKGGGAGGSIREAGGTFGKMEAAHEEEYFRRLREQQLKDLKKQVHEEQKFHDEEIDRHEREEQLDEIRKHVKQEMEAHIKENIEHLQDNIRQSEEAIKRHKKRIAELKKKAGSDSD